jgi:hypothetical protein
MFDYNLDHLGLGLIDDSGKIADRGAGYLSVRWRPVEAWGNHGARGRLPDDLHRRRRRPARRPQPLHAQVRRGTAGRRLVIRRHVRPARLLRGRNPIDRYSVGDRATGLRRDGDGSITIVIQHGPPGDISNWLLAPAVPFRPVMCLYQPQAAVLDGA